MTTKPDGAPTHDIVTRSPERVTVISGDDSLQTRILESPKDRAVAVRARRRGNCGCTAIESELACDSHRHVESVVGAGIELRRYTIVDGVQSKWCGRSSRSGGEDGVRDCGIRHGCAGDLCV